MEFYLVLFYLKMDLFLQEEIMHYLTKTDQNQLSVNGPPLSLIKDARK